MFIVSTVSKRIERGEPTVLAGKSGIEVVVDVMAETKGQELHIELQEHMGPSKEYWIAGQWPIINGVREESTAIFSRWFLLRIYK